MSEGALLADANVLIDYAKAGPQVLALASVHIGGLHASPPPSWRAFVLDSEIEFSAARVSRVTVPTARPHCPAEEPGRRRRRDRFGRARAGVPEAL